LKYMFFSLLISLINATVGFTQNFPVPEQIDGWQLNSVITGEITPSGAFQENVAMDLDSEGNLYIVDRGKNRLVKLSSDGFFLHEVGGFGDGSEEFNDPRDVDAHLTLNIYVADYNNDRIVRFDQRLNYLNEFKSTEDSPIFFERPLSVAVSNQYDIFLLDDLNKQVIKINRFNQPLIAFGDASDNLGQLLGPYQLALSQKNQVYVSDQLQKAVVIFDYLGNYIMELTHPEFQDPKGIDLDSYDQLVVTDPVARKIFFFRDHVSFTKELDFKSTGLIPVDAVYWQPRGKKMAYLYILTSQKCLVFSKNL
jgi:hypothetical protein